MRASFMKSGVRFGAGSGPRCGGTWGPIGGIIQEEGNGATYVRLVFRLARRCSQVNPQTFPLAHWVARGWPQISTAASAAVSIFHFGLPLLDFRFLPSNPGLRITHSRCPGIPSGIWAIPPEDPGDISAWRARGFTLRPLEQVAQIRSPLGFHAKIHESHPKYMKIIQNL